MGDIMTFPDTVDEFMEEHKMVDTKQVYSNGIEYVPIFRMKQWFLEHPPADIRPVKWIPVTERLPENGRYLAVCESYIKDGDPYVRILCYAKNLESVDFDFEGINRGGWYDYDSEVCFYEVNTVTHWMPLPSTEGLNEA